MRGTKAKQLRRQAQTETIGLSLAHTRNRYKQLKNEAKQKTPQVVKPIISKRQRRVGT